jgi:formylglycine-generating enzyme required for sulfatase activity
MKRILMLSLLYAVSACSQAERTAQTATPAQVIQSATPAANRAETKAYTNSIGMEFISIPADSFMMGAPDSDREAYGSEKPQHKVNLSKPFSIGKYEVT